ncbi:MAG: hypothetical protein ACO34E_12115, partial [Limisphaerales bacterium]
KKEPIGPKTALKSVHPFDGKVDVVVRPRWATSTNHPRIIGHLCTTWSSSEDLARVLLGEADNSDRYRQAQDLTRVLQACFGTVER